MTTESVDGLFSRGYTMSLMFESAEHTFLGDQIKLRLGESIEPASAVKLNCGLTPPGYGKQLTFGQIVALAGDFYGDPDAPISSPGRVEQRQAAYSHAYQTLAKGDTAELAKILAIMAKEQRAVDAAIRSSRQPSTAYDALGDSLSYEWNEATGGGYASLGKAGLLDQGRYLQLASHNFDHFGGDAWLAYSDGHTVALNFAAAGRQRRLSARQRDAYLKTAYAMDAFACHFLTDLFAAGHLRTPRRELYNLRGVPEPVSGLLALFMHAEDNLHGLTVRNGAGETWRAYGDKRLLDDVDRDNRRIAVEAVQRSADEIYEAFTSGKSSAHHEASHHVPQLRPEDTNPSPMFKLQHGKVLARYGDGSPVGKPSDYQWTDTWHAPPILAYFLGPDWEATHFVIWEASNLVQSIEQRLWELVS